MGAQDRVRRAAGRLPAAALALACLCGCAAAPGTEKPAPATSGTPLAQGCGAAELGAPDGDPGAIRAAVGAAEAEGAAVRMSWYVPDAGVLTAGSLEDLPAWSTSKIPLALAVIASGQGETYSETIALALEESDNTAADTLWNALGETDTERAGAVTGVLREAGDATTTVPDEQLVAGFSVFGQTQWATGDQVAFLAQLPCLDGSDEVIADMGQVDPAQSWGIGARPGAAYKGGWGPSPDGGYLAREFGWYPNAAGQRVLVAMAVQDPDGFEAATATLGRLSTALG
ncbi:serine hydrolase [Propionibacterium australiense]|uniref:Beta-lactamase/transpeptidase-like n=1 Tax=Propionibacterium australiense TaxID=119981 RepID=A0A383S5D8_9ACTN|nr:hypothetical protein [Propionibacterium australiense]RLP08209.1 hypothetical protein D7U36_10130 [Propionibacterium australiense]RLP08263.1 hypothetical protein D9T14_08805 [Propionibacterium australiense]SYZ33127.1 Beta-lactamase/transpeptidase-like [Propionibacterium australiense]VEH89143.1 Uncharacterised protein [Propionibacterium australiense]